MNRAIGLARRAGLGMPVFAIAAVVIACASLSVAVEVAGHRLIVPDPNSVVRLPPVEDNAAETIATPTSEAPSDNVPSIAELAGEVVEGEVVVEQEVIEEVVVEEIEKFWNASFELGVDGTGGNSETFNFRFGTELGLKISRYEFEADLDYRKNTADWAFIHGTVEYDEFRDFDLRVAVDIGVSRDLIKSDLTSLSARFGGGFSREIGIPEEYYVPELVFGADFEHQLSDRQKLTAKCDYMPDVTDWTDYRINTEAAWEVLIDKRWNLTLKTSVLNRYDSTPGTAKANDLDYSVVLLWSF